MNTKSMKRYLLAVAGIFVLLLAVLFSARPWQMIKSNADESVTLAITKVWDDGSNADGIRPGSVEIKILQNGKQYKTVNLTAEDNWYLEVTGAPKRDASGNLYQYTLDETVPDGYEATIETKSSVKTSFTVAVNPSEEHPYIGDKVTYTVEVVNSSDDNGTLSTTLNVGKGMTVTGITDGGVYDSKDGVITWSGLSISYNGTKKLYATVETTQAGAYAVSAKATIGSSSSTANSTITVKAKPEITSFSMTVTGETPESITLGDSVTVTWTIKVCGSEGANYTVTDSGVVLVSGSLSETLGSTGEAEIIVSKTVTPSAAGTTTVSNTAKVAAGDNTTLGASASVTKSVSIAVKEAQSSDNGAGTGGDDSEDNIEDPDNGDDKDKEDKDDEVVMPTVLTVTYKSEDGKQTYFTATFNSDEDEPEYKVYDKTYDEYITVIPSKADDSNYYYTFKEWVRTTDSDGNITYTASFSKEAKTTPTYASYTVSFYDTDGNVLKQDTRSEYTIYEDEISLNEKGETVETPKAVSTAKYRVGSTVTVTDDDTNTLSVDGTAFIWDYNDSRNITSATLKANGTELKLYFTKAVEVTDTEIDYNVIDNAYEYNITATIKNIASFDVNDVSIYLDIENTDGSTFTFSNFKVNGKDVANIVSGGANDLTHEIQLLGDNTILAAGDSATFTCTVTTTCSKFECGVSIKTIYYTTSSLLNVPAESLDDDIAVDDDFGIEVLNDDYGVEALDNSSGNVISFTVTNKHTPVATTSLTLKAAWDDSGDVDGLRPETLDLVIKRDGSTFKTVTLTASENWTTAVEGLQVKDPKTGKAYTYTVEEADVPDGYSAQVAVDGTTFTATNKHEAAANTVTYTITLNAGDGNIAEGTGFTYDSKTQTYTKSVAEGANATIPTPEAPSGYHFTAWDKTVPSTITEDITLTAQYGQHAGTAKGTVIKATCTEKGLEGMVCYTCGEIYNTKETEALGHNMAGSPVQKDGTAHVVKCTRCDYEEASDHSYGAWSTSTADGVTKMERACECSYKQYAEVALSIEADYAGRELSAEDIPNLALVNSNISGLKTVIAYYDEKGVELQSAPTNAGSYKAVVKVMMGETVLTEAEVSYEIEPVELTVSYVSETISVDGTPALAVNIQGFVGDDSADMDGFTAPTVSLGDIDLSKAGVYTLTPAGGNAGANYTFKYVAGTLTVKEQGAAAVTYPEYNKDPNEVLTVKADTFDAGSKVVVDLNGGTWEPEDNVWTLSDGKYAYTLKKDDSITLYDNPLKAGYMFMGWKASETDDGVAYTAQWGEIEAYITTNVVYDGTRQKPEITAKIAGVDIDAGRLTITDYRDKDGKSLGTDENDEPIRPIDAGTYTVEASIKDQLGVPVGVGTAEYTIVQRPLYIETMSDSKDYDGDELRAGGSITGFAGDEMASFTVTGSQTQAGSSTNTYTLAWTDANTKASNYKVIEKLGTLTVNDTGYYGITGKVVWDDADNYDKLRPTTVDVVAYQNGKAYETITATSDKEWAYYFKMLPKADKDGKAYTYTFGLKTVPDKYTVASKDNNVVATHTPVLSLDITAKWSDSNDSGKLRPSTAEVAIYQNGKPYKTVTLASKESWKTTVTELPRFDADGKAYTYTLKCDKVPDNYTAAVKDMTVTFTLKTTDKTTTDKTTTDKTTTDKTSTSSSTKDKTSSSSSDKSSSADKSTSETVKTGENDFLLFGLIGLMAVLGCSLCLVMTRGKKRG